MKILSSFIFILLLCACSSNQKASEPPQNPTVETNRMIEIWDNQIIQLRRTSGKWEIDPNDVLKIKKSLIQKINAKEYKNLKNEIQPHQLTKAFGKTIRFDTKGRSTVTFFIGLAKHEKNPFIFSKNINIKPHETSYETFLDGLMAHIKTVNKDIGSVKDASGKSVLEGYFVVASKDYEIAFMQWNSKLKPSVFAEGSKHTKRTAPQTSILFESNLAWEDPTQNPL